MEGRAQGDTGSRALRASGALDGLAAGQGRTIAGARSRIGHPANDNQPPLRHFLARLAWSIGIAAIVSGAVTALIHFTR
jgi:hypothetical protein